MKVEKNKLVFSTGRELEAHFETIGICPELAISEGADGGLDDTGFTREERAELARYMISLWRQWRSLTKKKMRERDLL